MPRQAEILEFIGEDLGRRHHPNRAKYARAKMAAAHLLTRYSTECLVRSIRTMSSAGRTNISSATTQLATAMRFFANAATRAGRREEYFRVFLESAINEIVSTGRRGAPRTPGVSTRVRDGRDAPVRRAKLLGIKPV